jgi:saccharopine dehydrogenase (NADP+, L-glutamate forming)/spermidine synthase
VVLAGRNPAAYIKDGRKVAVPGPELFADVVAHAVEGVGDLEIYPNRDSLGYRDLYGLQNARTLFRGTFRYPGHCRTWKGLADMGWLDLVERNVAGSTYGQLTASLIGSAGKDVRTEVADRLGMDPSDDSIERMAWLGLLSDDVIDVTRPTSPLDVLSALLELRLSYVPGEKDMIVLQHRFVAEYDDHTERIISTLVDTGVFGEVTSMARTVSLPAAMAARLLLDGRIAETGVHIPTVPAIYDPILDELATIGITFEETTEPA